MTTETLDGAAVTTAFVPRQVYPEHGGVYIGVRLLDGKAQHCFIPETERGHANFDNLGAAVTNLGEINGFSDWRPADMEDGMLTYVNARDLFPSSGLESVIWLNKPYGSDGAWALDFEDGYVGYWDRGNELAVLPVRSIIA